MELVDLIPARDAMVVAASDRIIACRVRRGGNISRLLERRLSETSPAPDPRVALLVGEGFVAHRVARDLAAKVPRCSKSLQPRDRARVHCACHLQQV